MYYFLALLLLMTLLILGTRLDQTQGKAEASGKPGLHAKTVSSFPGKRLSRDEIAMRLKKLAQSRTPVIKEKAAGQMLVTCYLMPPPLLNYAYICPKCKEKTLYPLSDEKAYETLEDMPTIRKLVERMTSLDLRVDESEFCRKCYSKIKEPRLILFVNTDLDNKAHLGLHSVVVHRKDFDEITILQNDRVRVHTVVDVHREDFVLLDEFLKGEAFHRDQSGKKVPLKKYIKRLEELLGVEIEEQRILK